MLRSGWPRTVCFIALVSTLFVLRNTDSATAPEPGDLRGVGKVTFPITCAPTIGNAGSDATIEGPAIPSFTAPTDVQSDFARGVALLHSFFYEEARRIFTSVAERDKSCAMAQWGVAMTWWHPIWTPPTPEEMASGTAAALRASQMRATPRERGFIDAINAYYATPDPQVQGPVGQSCHGP